ncbi:hypothetical protein INS49_000290 [Diaporthe citri]|uniref:uncharacterized protein n=1 Tax=Diaporthe citri TaxID=83186 RepID=UPI001C816161|nr:uncharacterized protein INS49_000290 [Diaporthe citri]KAG6366114.1 hypothetical protein INS49_000290 [Diaporthe citri]
MAFPSTALVIVYVVGFLIAAFLILLGAYDSETKASKWDKPWVPAVTRRDACAMPFFPVFYLLPAILWPLVVAFAVLVLIVSGLWMTLGSATSCCGIPLPGKKEDEGAGGGGGEEARDLEMGAVADGEDGDAPGGGEEADSDRDSVRSAVSAGSERPPPYTSVAPEEDGDRETDGLLGKGAK